MKLFFQTAFLLSLSAAPFSMADKGDNDGSVGKIYRGDKAEQGEFPYFVDLATCGAQLIAPQVVLSAAHCEAPENKKNLIIGAIKPGNDAPPAQKRNCLKWINHPLWDGDINNGNDYALCLLDAPATLDPNSNTTLVLNEDPSFPAIGDTTVACGMGYKNAFFQTPNNLLKNEMPVISTSNCGPQGDDFDDTDTVLCTRDRSTSICPGDSGGPLVTISENPDGTIVHTLVGLSSFIYGFCPSEWSGFARISAGMPWIRETVCGNGILADFCGAPPSCEDDPAFFDAARGWDCAAVGQQPERRCYQSSGAVAGCPATCNQNCP